MYNHEIVSFGPFEQHILGDELGNRLVIVPDRGACLLEIAFEGYNVLDGYETPQEVDFNRWAKNMPLFPFPNRLRDGRYQWGGHEYQFPIGDPMTENAIHGFGMDKEFALAGFELDIDRAMISFAYPYDGEDEAYPFPFLFQMDFQIFSSGHFTMTMTFTNEGDRSIPVGLGYHPYFRLGESVDDYRLALPPCEMIGLDDRMLPTGKRYHFDEFDVPRNIRSDVLDNCFALLYPDDQAEVEVKGTEGTLRYWQETGPGKFNFIQVFTPPYRTSLAIEPMTCNVDAFHNGDGLIEVAAGKTVSCRWGVQFSK